MQCIKVSQNEAGQRLDKLLAKYLNKAPKSFIYKMLRKKNIILNGKRADGSEKLCVSDEVKLFLADETIAKFSEVSIQRVRDDKLSIVYENEHVLVLNKPAGMLSQKAKDTDISAVEYIIAYLLKTGAVSEAGLRSFKPSVCNRLDRNTSGLVLAGKTLPGLQGLSAMLRDRTIGKYYRCLVWGRILEKKRIDGWLCKDEKRNTVTISEKEQPGSSYIQTEYSPVSHGQSLTLLEVRLLTGRSHQIRAHLASVGHGIVGDYKYGDREVNHYFKEKYGVTHQLLHACRLELPKLKPPLQDMSGMVLTAAVPEIFENIQKNENMI